MRKEKREMGRVEQQKSSNKIGMTLSSTKIHYTYFSISNLPDIPCILDISTNPIELSKQKR